MDDACAKEHLLKRLRRTREALIWKLDGLSEYDIRRPLTATGTNLLGLVREHGDATIGARPLDAPDHVPWWSQPDTTLFAVVVHTLDETARHAGHADILREHLDGQTGVTASQQEPVDAAAREAHWHKVEDAARAATSR
jgi:hypothetical protein